MSDDDVEPTFEPEDLQLVAGAVADAWEDHDEIALAGLSPEAREAQLDARQLLLDFIDDYWEVAKERDGHAVFHAPEWQVVAGMRDLVEQMRDSALALRRRDDLEG
jgi:hypothetical protein